MKTVTNLINLLVFAVAAFFIVIGLASLDNSITVAASAAMGSVLLVFIILTTVGRIERLLETQNDLLEEQNKVLKYMAKQRGDETK
jgi:hypothetical protein